MAIAIATGRPTHRLPHIPLGDFGRRVESGDSMSRSLSRGASLTRRGRLVRTLVLLMLAATGWMALSLADSPSTQAAAPSAASGPAVAATEPVVVHVVRPGETLWGIATLIAPERDPRIVIEDLREVNALPDSSLQIGQVLELPKAYLD